jgi:alkylated DNA repair dioxygenase AlkB
VAQASLPVQQTLFGGGPPRISDVPLRDVPRIDLDGSAWVQHVPGWVSGQNALLDALVTTTRWREEQRKMYDRIVTVPRLVASLPEDGVGHPLLFLARELLSAHYGVTFGRVSLGYYRSGDDSVAWHGDTIARELPDALVATLSLGGPRRLLLRPKGGGTSVAFSLGLGDLFVMGGTCQRTWQHGIPKVARAAPRVAVMFRPVWTRPHR